jgi:hypothetical protein
MRKLKLVSMMAVTAALLTGLTPTASAASAATNEVRNTGAIAIGAIQVFDGSYRNGTYDDLIPAGRFSGYAHTAGFYVGPGYCVRVRGWLSGTQEFPPPPANLTDPIIVHGGTNGFQYDFRNSPPVRVGYDVRALPSTDPGCHDL